jgi:hypothetical protein
MKTRSQFRGMQRIAAGCYADAAGAMHIDLIEFCKYLGVAPTVENQLTAQRIIQRTLREALPEHVFDDVEIVLEDHDE